MYDAGNNDYASPVESRLNREWRVRETGTVGTVLVQFDVSGLIGPGDIVGANDESQIVLLVDADGDFSTAAATVSQAFVTPGDGLVNFRVDFTDGLYFTLASSEQHALPVNLISFEAEVQENHINLEWRTASEENHSHFLLQRSADGISFETLATIEGYSQQLNNGVKIYRWKDLEPINGDNFYKLVDVSKAGEEESSEIIGAFYVSASSKLKVYPNPVSIGGLLKLELPFQAVKAKLAFMI